MSTESEIRFLQWTLNIYSVIIIFGYRDQQRFYMDWPVSYDQCQKMGEYMTVTLHTDSVPSLSDLESKKWHK